MFTLLTTYKFEKVQIYKYFIRKRKKKLSELKIRQLTGYFDGNGSSGISSTRRPLQRSCAVPAAMK
jgi:hypothetical protein